ncbi:MAG: LCP family protein [Erysipelotrichaceae bacterium]
MKKRKQKQSIFKNINFYFIAIMVLASIILAVKLITLGILPTKYLIPVLVVLLLLCGLMYLLLFSKRINKFNQILGKIMCVLLSVLLIVANMYIFKYGDTIGSISGADTQTSEISVVVLKEDQAKSLKDIKGKTIGIQKVIDQDNTSYALNKIKEETGAKAKTVDFTSYKDQVQGLYDKDVRAIVLNEFARKTIEEDRANFSKETKVLKTFKRSVKVKQTGKKVSVTKDPFTVFISGIDTYGPVSTVSRSDVNMVMTVNPKTKQILLTSIPRDFYVPFSCLNGTLDKLTHAGIYGVECSMGTVGNLLDTEINYYGRVNFSSLVTIINALDGVVVNNPVAFSDGTYNFAAGDIYLNGDEALAFSRDRYHQAGGDRGRGKNQMRVITGIINKAISSKIITNYSGIMSAISGSFETSMSSGDVNSLVQMQLDDMSGWNITQISVDGTGGTDFAYSLGDYAYVMYPTQATVDNAKRMIDQVENGETPTE